MKLLVTGANGQLGKCLQDRASESEFTIVTADLAALDITNEAAVREIIRQHSVDAIVNAAAYTAVDTAEREAELAYAVNSDGAYNLAQSASQSSVPLIHISTDYVFDGTATEPYLTDHPSGPLGIYGKSKWRGETLVRDTLAQHVIIRTSWVFSEYGNNFVKTILRLAGERDELNVVADQYGCPTYAGDLATGILLVCNKISNGQADWGTYHHCGDHPTSWHGFTRAIIDEAKKQGKLAEYARLNAICAKDYPLPAPRPSYSVLDCSSMFDVWGVGPSNWRQSLKRVIARLP